MVGARSRINNNYSLLTEEAKKYCEIYGLKFPSHSPFMNIKAQAIEMIHLSSRLVDVLEQLSSTTFKEDCVKYNVGGVSITEAPRGILVHHYKVDEDGKIVEANIITPTAQNYKSMEHSLQKYLTTIVERDLNLISRRVEEFVRAYDPCVSCSARFLREH